MIKPEAISGTAGRTWTGTSYCSPDFESSASTNSATAAQENASNYRSIVP